MVGHELHVVRDGVDEVLVSDDSGGVVGGEGGERVATGRLFPESTVESDGGGEGGLGLAEDVGEDGLGGDGAERDQGEGRIGGGFPDGGEVGKEVGDAVTGVTDLGDFVAVGVAAHGVGQVDGGSLVEVGAGDVHLAEELAGFADEGEVLLVLVEAGVLADEDEGVDGGVPRKKGIG
jgi:hypothetical protein